MGIDSGEKALLCNWLIRRSCQQSFSLLIPSGTKIVTILKSMLSAPFEIALLKFDSL